MIREIYVSSRVLILKTIDSVIIAASTLVWYHISRVPSLWISWFSSYHSSLGTAEQPGACGLVSSAEPKARACIPGVCLPHSSCWHSARRTRIELIWGKSHEIQGTRQFLCHSRGPLLLHWVICWGRYSLKSVNSSRHHSKKKECSSSSALSWPTEGLQMLSKSRSKPQ